MRARLTAAAILTMIGTVVVGARVAHAAPLAAPVGVAATLASPTQINLTWTAVSGAAAYRVLRGTVTGGPYTQVGMSSGPNFANTGLALNKTYFYVVQTYNGTFSGNSAQVSATTGGSPAPQVAPDPPTNLAATAANGAIQLTWTASTGAAVYHYDILRGTSSGGEAAVDAIGGTVTSYADVTAPGAAGLYYVIRAVGAYGSSLSNEVFVPGAPTLGATSASDVQIDLSWTASTNATSYKLFRSTSSSGPFTTPFTTVTAPTTTASDSGLTADTTYYYVVQAVATGGTGTGTSLNSSVASAPTGPPQVTLSSVTVVNDVQLDLNWTASSGTATAYRVSRGPSTGTEAPVALVTAPSLTFSDTPLAANTAYFYTVTAVNGSNGTRSRPSNELSKTTAPPTPTLSTGTVTASSIQLNWGVSGGATSYRVFTGPNGGPYSTELPGSPTGATTLTHSGLTASTGYFYVIRAIGPNGTSRDSTVFGAMTAPPPAGWTNETSMSTARYGVAVVTGGDGRIYATGGYPSAFTVEAYSTATGTWTPCAPMITPRLYHAAAAGPDGRIYAIGGIPGGGNPVATVEVYDPGTNSWAFVAPMNNARYFPSATLGPDGKIYVAGGFNATLGYLSLVESYNPATNTWTNLAPMSAPRDELALVTGTDGKIYAIGGNLGTPLALVEAYDPVSNTWSAAPSLRTPHEFLAATRGSDGRIYAIGGFNSGGEIATVEAYTPGAPSWVSVPAMNTARYGHGAALGPNGRIYAIGGYNNALFHLNRVEGYGP